MQQCASGAFSFPEPIPQNKTKTMNNTLPKPHTKQELRSKTGSGSVNLHYREGGSDKVYQVQLEPKGDGYTVDIAYGRRGSTLNTGTKTPEPVPYEKAKRIYDKLVRTKLAKGYTPNEDGNPFEHSAKAGRFTGVQPQLLNAIDESAVARLIADDDWCLQEKFDGRRQLIRKRDGVMTLINRRGLIIGGSDTILSQARDLPGDFLLDGECVGEAFHAFDLLETGSRDLRTVPYRERLVELINLLARAQHPNIQCVDTAFDAPTKLRWVRELREANREGLVLKRLTASYTAGRPATGGDQLKHKFCETLSAVVAQRNQQRSVEIRLFGELGWQSAGNVTIPPNHEVPEVGQVVEVRFLYAFRESGVLYQPVYLGPREDVTPGECVTDQLKFKPEEGT
jgi:bifunctional non-homologous end joining protein LigD